MRSSPRGALVLVALMAAGESIFLLPFALTRIFRPTFLAVFGVTNLELGTAFSAYGLVAIVAYFGGGPLADAFSARRLMTVALLSTAVGGGVLAGTPGPAGMNALWGAWGLTTILLFWAALLRATREWGGEGAQGRAYGLLDGGRGLLAALVSSAAVLVFAVLLPEDAKTASLEARTVALRAVIWLFTGVTGAVALLVWVVVPDSQVKAADRPKLSVAGMIAAARMPVVWLHAIIVVCAYVGYKATDDFSLLAQDALGFDDVQASSIGTLSFWVRAVTAVAAGFLGDRFQASRVIFFGFALQVAGCLAIASGQLPVSVPWMMLMTIVVTSVGVYALRAVYFALLAEGAVPLAFTGSAIGLVSLIGFTPDVFSGPLMGWLLDRSPGVLGHQHLFLMVAGFGVAGLVATVLFRIFARQRSFAMQ